MIHFDPETIEKLRAMGPRKAYDHICQTVHQIPGGASSEEFQQAFETMVDHGVLSWEQIEEYETA
jgi:hypothetical protein